MMMYMPMFSVVLVFMCLIGADVDVDVDVCDVWCCC